MAALPAFVTIEDLFSLIDIEVTRACIAQGALVDAVFTIPELEDPAL